MKITPLTLADISSIVSKGPLYRVEPVSAFLTGIYTVYSVTKYKSGERHRSQESLRVNGTAFHYTRTRAMIMAYCIYSTCKYEKMPANTVQQCCMCHSGMGDRGTKYETIFGSWIFLHESCYAEANLHRMKCEKNEIAIDGTTYQCLMPKNADYRYAAVLYNSETLFLVFRETLMYTPFKILTLHLHSDYTEDFLRQVEGDVAPYHACIRTFFIHSHYRLYMLISRYLSRHTPLSDCGDLITLIKSWCVRVILDKSHLI